MQVSLTPLQEEHAETSYHWRNDATIWELTGSRPNRTITCEIELEWVKNVLQRNNEKRFAIIADNTYVGNVQLTNIKNGTAEFHIFIGDKNYWGKQIATIATQLMIQKAFLTYDLKNIYLFVDKRNKSAQKVYEKNGFVIIQEDETQFKMILSSSEYLQN